MTAAVSAMRWSGVCPDLVDPGYLLDAGTLASLPIVPLSLKLPIVGITEILRDLRASEVGNDMMTVNFLT